MFYNHTNNGYILGNFAGLEIPRIFDTAIALKNQKWRKKTLHAIKIFMHPIALPITSNKQQQQLASTEVISNVWHFWLGECLNSIK